MSEAAGQPAKKVMYRGREYVVPEWAKFAATDFDGEIFFYRSEPYAKAVHVVDGVWCPKEYGCHNVHPIEQGDPEMCPDWKDSLANFTAPQVGESSQENLINLKTEQIMSEVNEQLKLSVLGFTGFKDDAVVLRALVSSIVKHCLENKNVSN